MRKIFNQNRVAPVRLRRRKTWQLILSFVLLVALLFTLSFIISYNMLRGGTAPNNAKIAELEKIIEEKDEIIAELQMQLASHVPTQAPDTSATPKPSAAPSSSQTPKPVASPTKRPVATATAKPAPTARPTETPIE